MTAQDILGPERARAALEMVLVKSDAHRRALATVAELFREGAVPEDLDDALAAHLRTLSDDDLHAFVVDALSSQDGHGSAAAAKELVDRHVTISPGAPVAGNVHVLRAFRAAKPEQMRDELEDSFAASDHDPLGSLRAQLWRDEMDRRLEALRQEIETEVRRRLVHDRGAASVADAIRTSVPDDVDFLTASTAEIRNLTAVLETLPSRLERQLRQADARPPTGRLDIRNTMRSSMATGGVPARPVFHPRKPPRPELIVLADISGSVASFARFTLSLAHGLQSRFHSVRSFVFVDGVDEVTELLRSSTDVRKTAEHIDDHQLGVHLDGRSDYGHVFQEFWKEWGHQLNPRTIVLVLGDARSNFRNPQEDSLKAIGRRAGRLFWLNPERRATWQDGDSLIDIYRPHCHGVFEVRNIRQLEDFVVHHAN